MSGWLNALIKFGVLAALVAAIGRVTTQWLRNRSAREARAEKRTRDLSDKQIQRRREAYETLLEEVNTAVSHQFAGKADRMLTSDEFQKRIKMMRDIDLYGSNEVKGLSAYVASYLKRELSEDEHSALIDAVQRLSKRMREELED